MQKGHQGIEEFINEFYSLECDFRLSIQYYKVRQMKKQPLLWMLKRFDPSTELN